MEMSGGAHKLIYARSYHKDKVLGLFVHKSKAAILTPSRLSSILQNRKNYNRSENRKFSSNFYVFAQTQSYRYVKNHTPLWEIKTTSLSCSKFHVILINIILPQMFAMNISQKHPYHYCL